MTMKELAEREYADATEALREVRTRMAPIREQERQAIVRLNTAFAAVISAKLRASQETTR